MRDTKHCGGCRNDFYNGQNGLGVKRCWSLADAKLVKRYRTGTWTLPASKGAFTEVRVPNCYHASGVHFTERLPDFVKSEDVVRRDRAGRGT